MARSTSAPTGPLTGGLTGGDTGGLTGGDTGGHTGGLTGGLTGGDTGGLTGGDTGGAAVPFQVLITFHGLPPAKFTRGESSHFAAVAVGAVWSKYRFVAPTLWAFAQGSPFECRYSFVLPLEPMVMSNRDGRLVES